VFAVIGASVTPLDDMLVNQIANSNSNSVIFKRPGKRGLYDPAFEHDSCGVGFVAHIGGQRSHEILQDAYEVLKRMDHRGAVGSEANTGDGAGILTALPHEFMTRVVRDELKQNLPSPGRFGAGLVFLPRVERERELCRQTVSQLVLDLGQRLIGWRPVPVQTDHAELGATARASEPYMEHLVIGASDDVNDEDFERRLYMIRKQASHLLRGT